MVPKWTDINGLHFNLYSNIYIVFYMNIEGPIIAGML